MMIDDEDGEDVVGPVVASEPFSNTDISLCSTASRTGKRHWRT